MKKAKKPLVTGLCILLGNAVLAFLVAAFVIPHDIIMGGTTGIGIVLARITGWDTAAFVLILNLLLLLLGRIVLGRQFMMTTIASSILYPILLGLFQRIPGIDRMTGNTLLAAIFAGCLMGVALGLVMRVGSSTGGMDIVNLVFHRWTHIPLSVLVYITDIIVVGGQAIFSPAESTLYGILVLFLETIVLDKVMIVGKSQLQIFVVSEQYELLREKLLTELEAGVTMTLIETGRLGQEQKGILCVIPPRKLYDATELIQTADPQAFITVTKINEVRGRGFTMERKLVDPPET